MLYLVEVEGSMEKATEIDRGSGPGPTIAKIKERFRPQSFWGDPTRRRTFMLVELETPAKIAELMYVLTWFAGTNPRFTPLMPAEVFGEAMENAKKIVLP
ncbi:MAG: DUF3303 family protein [Acidobacteriota bacterium]